MNAFVLLRKLTTDRLPTRRDDDQATESRVKVWFKLDKRVAIFTADLRLLTNENNADIIVSSKESWYAKDFTDDARRINLPLSLARMADDYRTHGYFSRRIGGQNYLFSMDDDSLPEEFRKPVSSFAKYLAEMKYYSATQFTNPARCPVSFQVESEGSVRRVAELRGHTKFLYDLFTEYKERLTSNYDQFFEVIGPDGIGLVDKLRFKEIPTSSVEYSVRSGGKVGKHKRTKMLVIPQFIIGRNELSPSQLSEGTFKTITLLFYLITETSSALLIEEPEVCVHHGLLSSIVELIKTYSRQKQIILSTHSDFVLDQIKPRHVYGVARSKHEGTTVAHVTKSLSAKELAALRHYLETEGNLGEYWRHGGLEQ